MGLRSHGHFQSLVPLLISFMILSSSFAKAEAATDDELVQLARKHFNYNLIKSEQEQKALDKLFLRVHQGKVAKFGPENPTDEDVSKGNSWGPERTVKAEWIVWVCKDPDAVKMVQPSGIEIDGAKVDGELDLSWLKMDGQLKADVLARTLPITYC
jgi:hypothetical protein